MTNSRHIVLVGGGHAHVHVLAAFGKWRDLRLSLTLISPESLTIYSGMAPGVIAGHFATSGAHIDLVALTKSVGANRIEGQVCGIDRQNRLILLQDGRRVGYDLASINAGVTPDFSTISGAAENAISVKPIGRLLGRVDSLLTEASKPGGPRHIMVVGGGAAGVELVLSLRERILCEKSNSGFSFSLATRGEILLSHNVRVREAFRRILRERSVALYEHFPVSRIGPGCVERLDGASIAADAIFVATAARAPGWLCETGLAVDDRGFLRVRPSLQCLNDDHIFAAGDCAEMVGAPREKAGVYAVRAGPPLAGNLRRIALGEAPLSWRPQTAHLSLITTGDRYAVASRGWWKTEGRWVWMLKSWIDRRWMAQYQTK